MDSDRFNVHKPSFPDIEQDVNTGKRRRLLLLSDEQYQSTMVAINSIQMKVFNFLERPTGWKCFIYHFAVFCLVLLCLVLSVMDDPTESLNQLLFTMEVVMTSFFAVEYCVRCWAAGYHGKYAGLKGRLRFMRKPIAIIDLTVIFASFIWLQFGGDGQGQVFATSAFRGIRFLQILRMLHVDRHGGSWKLLMSVVYIHRTELITSMYIGFLCLIFASYFVFLSEKEMLIIEAANNSTGPLNTDIISFGDSLWWGIITVATIGYGDKVPRTWIGRVIASLYCIIATAFFALPSGILGSGFALKVQQTQRQKHFNRQIPPAATLIQMLWRLFEMEASARQKKETASVRYFIDCCNSKGPRRFESLSAADTPLKNPKPQKNIMFISHPLISIIRTTQNIHMTMATDELFENSDRENSETMEDQNSLKAPEPSGDNNTQGRHASITSLQNECRSGMATPQFDISMGGNGQRNAQDDSSVKFKPNSPRKTQKDCFNSQRPSLNGESKASNIHFRETTELSKDQRTMILIILRMKVFVAKRKFQQSRKPYDVRDVIEQYSQGNTNVVVRLKNLQRRIDSLYDHIERRNDVEVLRNVYDRVTRVETQIGDLSKKMNRVVELLELRNGGQS